MSRTNNNSWFLLLLLLLRPGSFCMYNTLPSYFTFLPSYPVHCVLDTRSTVMTLVWKLLDCEFLHIAAELLSCPTHHRSTNMDLKRLTGKNIPYKNCSNCIVLLRPFPLLQFILA